MSVYSSSSTSSSSTSSSFSSLSSIRLFMNEGWPLSGHERVRGSFATQTFGLSTQGSPRGGELGLIPVCVLKIEFVCFTKCHIFDVCYPLTVTFLLFTKVCHNFQCTWYFFTFNLCVHAQNIETQ